MGVWPEQKTCVPSSMAWEYGPMADAVGLESAVRGMESRLAAAAASG
jgi:hypothetical protein